MNGPSILRSPICRILVVGYLSLIWTTEICGQPNDVSVVARVQAKMVKLNGSGGFRGLESYQSGFLISGEGHIATVWSYVLDSESITATLDDGQKFEAKLLGYDPQIEIALLKIEASELPFFDLGRAASPSTGSRVLAFSNLYGVATGDEPYSVQQGVVMALTQLSARKGATQSNYQGPVFVLDAMTNNPGAAGGAVTNRSGQILGMLGKELRDVQTDSWLNFAIPISELANSIADIRSGKMIVNESSESSPLAEPMSAELLGFVLVPDVVARTPPFIEIVSPRSAFDRAGIRADDLIIEVQGKLTPTCHDVANVLRSIDRDATMFITIQRNRKFQKFEIRLNQ